MQSETLKQKSERERELELFKRYMHISDCKLIENVWRDEWGRCPVCGCPKISKSLVGHYIRKGVLV